jgi:hypothetical protein
MAVEHVFVLNTIEKQAVEELILKLDSGVILTKQKTNNTNDIHSEISYEYRSTKAGKTIHGALLDCWYRLRYRDNNHIFFSAWDCKDVCGVFYDLIGIIHLLNDRMLYLRELHREFEVDLNLAGYVFVTGPVAGSFVNMADYLSSHDREASHNSQYIHSIFTESDKGVYDALIEKLKAAGYSQIRILQLWIRGEILYYVIADGVVLRPGHQRSLTNKEEQDLIRKTYKTVNELSRTLEPGAVRA